MEQPHDFRAVARKDNHTHGKAKMLEVLTYAEVIRGDVIVKKEVLDFALDGCSSKTSVVAQTAAETDFSIEHLASGERLVVLDELQYVERHIVVASPRHIRKRVVNDDRHDVNVFFEDR